MVKDRASDQASVTGFWFMEKRYLDDGCHVHPSCLSCPLPRCIYDNAIEQRREREMQRATKIVSAFVNGGTLEEVAQTFQISKRSALRYKAKAVVM